MTDLRRIYPTQTTSQGEIKDLLQMIFVNELLKPSNEVWIVSPWISDIEILDNRMGGFDGINPEWKGRKILLTEISVQLMSIGSDIIFVMINADHEPHNRYFLDRVSSLAAESGLKDKLKCIEVPKPEKGTGLHIKGILTDKGYLSGSMNITKSGLELNEEGVIYDINDQRIIEGRNHFQMTYLGDN